MMPSFGFSGLDHGGCSQRLDTDGPVNITAAGHASSYASPKCPFPRGCGPYLTVVPPHVSTPAAMTSRPVLPFLHSLHRIFHTLHTTGVKIFGQTSKYVGGIYVTGRRVTVRVRVRGRVRVRVIYD